MHRRTLLGVLSIGVIEVLAGCAKQAVQQALPTQSPAGVPTTATRSTAPASTPTPLEAAAHPTPTAAGGFPPPHPGPAKTVFNGNPAKKQIALTIDDGFDVPTVSAYVEFAKSTGTHITFNPNGLYAYAWEPHAKVLRPLIERGQVQIGNHTLNHKNLQALSDSGIEAELEQNEEWIEKTFGITSRPYYRPPYGYHDERTDSVAASLGYTNTLMWNGSLGDSALLTPQVLLQQAYKYVGAGVVMLGHANHPTVTGLYPQLLEIISERGLTAVTLDEMFGTSRRTG